MDVISRLAPRCVHLARGAVVGVGTSDAMVQAYLRGDKVNPQDVKMFRTVTGNSCIRVIGIKCLRLNGDAATAVAQGEEFLIGIEVQSDCSSLYNVAVVIEGSALEPLFTTHLCDSHVPAGGNSVCHLTVRISPASLRAGGYCVSVAVFDIHGVVYHDVVLHYPLFDVIDSATSGFPHDTRWGHMYFPCNWELTYEQKS